MGGPAGPALNGVGQDRRRSRTAAASTWPDRPCSAPGRADNSIVARNCLPSATTWASLAFNCNLLGRTMTTDSGLCRRRVLARRTASSSARCPGPGKSTPCGRRPTIFSSTARAAAESPASRRRLARGRLVRGPCYRAAGRPWLGRRRLGRRPLSGVGRRAASDVFSQPPPAGNSACGGQNGKNTAGWRWQK